MKILHFLLFFLFFLIQTINLFAWGFYAHRKINRMAVYALPYPLSDFYKKNINYVADHSVDPDRRKHVDSTEASRHFINIDHYGKSAFDDLPKNWNDAIKKYSKNTLDKYGTLPWEIVYWEKRLTKAFADKDSKEILHASSYIGHYIADAHVPLHTVSNFNGQESNQVGVHSLWETAIPEMFGETYKHINSGAVYLTDPAAKIWSIVKESHALAPTVLYDEKLVAVNFPGNKKYSVPPDKNDKYVFNPGYVEAYNKALNGMVEDRLRSSAIDVASFWYTAWFNAGQPELGKLK